MKLTFSFGKIKSFEISFKKCLHLKERSVIIAFAVKKEANTNEITNLNVSKISKKVLDNLNGLMYDIRVASEKEL